MKQILSTVLLIVLVFIFANCEFSTANLSDPKVCTSMDGDLCSQDMPVVSTETSRLFASCNINNAPAQTKVKFTWLYYGENKITIDEVIFDTEDKGTNLNLHSSLSRPNNGWPKGVYEVEMKILVENKKPVIKQFTIE